MDLMSLILTLLVVGVAWYLTDTYVPLSRPVKVIIRVLFVIVIIVIQFRGFANVRLLAQTPPAAAKQAPPIDPPPVVENIVRPGESLQAAINAAAPGATLLLMPGGVYPGGVRIPKAITIKPTTWAMPEGQRVANSASEVATVKARMPQITVTANQPAFDITGSNVTLRGIAMLGDVDTMVLCGHGDSSQTTLEQVPRTIVFDQVVIEGNAVPSSGSLKRGIGLHCAEASITNSAIHQTTRKGQDSQTIGGWNGPGPYTIRNNYLSGGAETIMFGGAAPAIPQTVAADILIEGNTLTFPIELKATRGVRKNIFELKAAKRVTVRNNLLENAWADAQAGWCIVLTPSQGSGSGGFTEAVVEDVLIEHNEIRTCGGVFNILGRSQSHDTHPTLPSQRITIRDNWIHGVDTKLGAHGSLIQIGGAPTDLVMEWNTIEANGTAFLRKSDSVPARGFKFTGNLVQVGGTYGSFLASVARCASMDLHFPDGDTTAVRNVVENAFIAGHPTFRTNCPTNTYVATCTYATGTTCAIPPELIVGGYGTGEVAGFGRRRLPSRAVPKLH